MGWTGRGRLAKVWGGLGGGDWLRCGVDWEGGLAKVWGGLGGGGWLRCGVDWEGETG